MLHPTHKIALVVIACGLLLFPNEMWGQKGKPREVQDEAKLFSEKAIEETNAIIAKIKEKVKKDLVVETVEKGPDRAAAAKWAAERFADTGAEGVYIVIATNPKLFEIVVSKKTREMGYFTIANRDEIKSLLTKNLKDKRDEALVRVAQYTFEAMSENAKKLAPKLVKDEAKLFSEKAIKSADAIVTKIRESHQKDLFIETLEKGVDAKEYPAWARERAQKVGVDGVYIVITTDPKRYQVIVGEKTRTSGLFTNSDRDEAAKMLRGLGDDRDDTLLKVATFVQEAMDQRKKDDK
jgi:uncharacterized membrane protein YgcG